MLPVNDSQLAQGPVIGPVVNSVVELRQLFDGDSQSINTRRIMPSNGNGLSRFQVPGRNNLVVEVYRNNKVNFHIDDKKTATTTWHTKVSYSTIRLPLWQEVPNRNKAFLNMGVSSHFSNCESEF